MAFDHEQRQARRLLDGVEMGTLDTYDAFALIERSDPCWVYLMFTWLRAHYANHSASDGVFGRIADICTTHPKAAAMMREGQRDALTAWFEETYEYRELDADDFVRIVVEKLES